MRSISGRLAGGDVSVDGCSLGEKARWMRRETGLHTYGGGYLSRCYTGPEFFVGLLMRLRDGRRGRKGNANRKDAHESVRQSGGCVLNPSRAPSNQVSTPLCSKQTQTVGTGPEPDPE